MCTVTTHTRKISRQFWDDEAGYVQQSAIHVMRDCHTLYSDSFELLMEEYIDNGLCLFPELFSGQWKEHWMDPCVATAISMLISGSTLSEILKAGIIREEYQGVYSLPVFTREACDMIVAETENIIKYSIDNDIEIHRPNSMNRYGLVLNLVGMKHVLTDLQQNYFLPMSKLLFPVEGAAFSDHHTFIVSYESSRDRALDMHTDDSDVTWNVCLGKEGFTGSGLTFCGRLAEASHRKLLGHYDHVVGRAVVHLGHQRHGADSITGGERHNLIMWCKNQEYRSSDLFESRMRHYEKESGPPDLLCLSYTHDRDYIAFKEYPKGKNPYCLDSDSELEDNDNGRADSGPQSMPWCPPASFQYDGMYSQNKLMLIHFQKEVKREEEQQLKKKQRVDGSIEIESVM